MSAPPPFTSEPPLAPVEPRQRPRRADLVLPAERLEDEPALVTRVLGFHELVAMLGPIMRGRRGRGAR